MRTVPPPPRPSPRPVAPPGRARAYLDLLRPANIATALADVLAGASAGGVLLGSLAFPASLGWLLVATACLYAGGIVLNDVFDRAVDATERPERPIPSGRVTAAEAAGVGAVLLAAGVAAAATVGASTAAIAVGIALAVVSYDAWGKRHAFIGPVNMGLCRALNLMLGVAITPAAMRWAWPLGLLPLTYIAAVTMASRGEVHGGKRPVLRAALGLVAGVVIALGALAVGAGPGIPGNLPPGHRGWSLLLVLWLAWRVIPAFRRAARTTAPADIRRAVRTGVLSLVLLDAVIAAAYAGIMNSLAVLATGLLAWWLGRQFAVT